MSQIVYREFPISLSANEEDQIHFPGNTIAILEASGSMDIKIGDNPRTTLRSGIRIRVPDFENFQKIQIFETAGASATATIALSNGDIDDNRLSVAGEITLSTPTGIDSASDVSVAATTTALIAAANASRKEVILRNIPTNTHNFKVGDSGAGTTNGISLQPGEGIVLTTEAAIYAYNTKGSAQSIEVVEIE